MSRKLFIFSLVLMVGLATFAGTKRRTQGVTLPTGSMPTVVIPNQDRGANGGDFMPENNVAIYGSAGDTSIVIPYFSSGGVVRNFRAIYALLDCSLGEYRADVYYNGSVVGLAYLAPDTTQFWPFPHDIDSLRIVWAKTGTGLVKVH